MNELTVRNDLQTHQHDWQLYLANFLRTQNGKAYKTIKAYQGGVLSFLRFMEEREIPEPLPDDIHDYLGYLKEQHKSVFTIGLYMIALKLFFAYLEKPYQDTEVKVYPDIYSLANPKVPRPQRNHHFRLRPTDEEVVRLRSMLLNKRGQKARRDLLMIDLCLYCGLRVNEVANVKKEDLSKEGEKFKLFVLRKGKSRKINFVWIDPELAQRIFRYAKKYKLEGYVFTDISNRGTPGHLPSSTVSTKIGRYLQKAGIKRDNITAHSLRHYAGTAFYQETRDIYATQQFMGHSDSETTRIYMHVDDNYEKAGFALAPAS